MVQTYGNSLRKVTAAGRHSARTGSRESGAPCQLRKMLGIENVIRAYKGSIRAGAYPTVCS